MSSMRFPVLGRETRKDGDREAMSEKGMRLSRITMNPMVSSLKGPNEVFISKNTKHDNLNLSLGYNISNNNLRVNLRPWMMSGRKTKEKRPTFHEYS
jgi:hypothetical protein